MVDYQYNDENRLTKVTNNFATQQHHMSPNGKEISFAYDALGRKVKKEVTPFNQGQDKEVESYIYNGLGIDVLTEYLIKQPTNNKNNQVGKTERINEYYYGNGQLVAVKEMKFQGNSKFNWNNDTAQSVAFYHQDALGSVALLSDWHGHTIEKFEYDVYGVYYAGKFDKSTPGQGQGCGIGWHSNPYGFTGNWSVF